MCIPDVRTIAIGTPLRQPSCADPTCPEPDKETRLMGE